MNIGKEYLSILRSIVYIGVAFIVIIIVNYFLVSPLDSIVSFLVMVIASIFTFMRAR